MKNIDKSSRHSKIAGDFGESLFLYWLSKSGYEVALIDHTGIDLIAYNKNSKKRIGISVKTRTRKIGTENEGVYVKLPEIHKIKDSCYYFACEPYFGIVIDRISSIDALLISVDDIIKINGIGKRFLNIKVTDKYIKEYMKLNDILMINFSYKEIKK
jgi:Holliday junction resolvase-like predicted endonuclease